MKIATKSAISFLAVTSVCYAIPQIEYDSGINEAGAQAFDSGIYYHADNGTESGQFKVEKLVFDAGSQNVYAEVAYEDRESSFGVTSL